MPKHLLSFLLLLSPVLVSGQSYGERFSELFEKKDTAGQRQLLEEWQSKDSNDAELYIGWFNYYINLSKTGGLRLDTRAKEGEEALMVTDSNSDTVAFILEETFYQQQLLEAGFRSIKKGISKHPRRLDMRFGHIYMLGENEQYDRFTEEIIKTIDYSEQIKNDWLWSEGKALENPENFFLSALQDYVMTLYNTMDDSLMKHIDRIATTVLKYHPEHVESLSNLALVHLVAGEYKKALEPLLRAEKLSPEDWIVLNNIAYAYKNLGERKKAMSYYEKVRQYGDEDARKRAEEELKELGE